MGQNARMLFKWANSMMTSTQTLARRISGLLCYLGFYFSLIFLSPKLCLTLNQYKEQQTFKAEVTQAQFALNILQ